MKMVVNLLSYILFLLLVLYFVSYARNTENRQTLNPAATVMPVRSTVSTNQFTIGWSVYNSSYEFFHAMQNGVLAKAEELGIKVITHDQKSSTVEMITGVNNLIAQGINALVISPFNPEAMPVIFDSAREAGIPVVVVDIGTGGTDVDAFIISDNFAGGSLAGEYALELIRERSLPSRNAAIIKVEETSIHARRRGEGFKDIMTQNGYQVVAEVTANSETTQAYEAMKGILDSYGNDLAVVFAENDRMALGAAQAVEEAGKMGQIMVIGFDGDPAAITAIKEGRMQGTIAQQPFKMGELGVDVTYRLLTGQRVIYDDLESKELFSEIYLIDDTGQARRYDQNQ
ncbi:substrate-binding domain-containing protein [Anaerocolumna sedimenticola]|uniref:Substrate-binding domain-containing protein n=1 Tax=Anaerocolumna sedimenticola TaxID=2696063 RepID=A0A6P1TPJ1_9FIRM|nr:substrate-binding domain-containing protein [Anaerocolumna sedimenticola]QHQ61308.1 substrate-binding domain-containing protein [Anaerocolumna sedimenticola]